MPYNICSPQAKEYIVGNIVAAEWASPLSGIAANNAMQQMKDFYKWKLQKHIENEHFRWLRIERQQCNATTAGESLIPMKTYRNT